NGGIAGHAHVLSAETFPTLHFVVRQLHLVGLPCPFGGRHARPICFRQSSHTYSLLADLRLRLGRCGQGTKVDWYGSVTRQRPVHDSFGSFPHESAIRVPSGAKQGVLDDQTAGFFIEIWIAASVSDLAGHWVSVLVQRDVEKNRPFLTGRERA